MGRHRMAECPDRTRRRRYPLPRRRDLSHSTAWTCCLDRSATVTEGDFVRLRFFRLLHCAAMGALFFFAFGGAITLNILEIIGVGGLEGWTAAFTTATVLLLALNIIARVSRGQRISRNVLEKAVAEDRVRAAMIVSRRETGTYINDQPQVEFTLLVDRREGDAFLTKARRVVSFLDVDETRPGVVVAVLHPGSDSGTVHFADLPIPESSRELSLEVAKAAHEIPNEIAKTTTKRLTGLLVCAVAFLLGALGGPLLASPKVFSHAQEILAGTVEDGSETEAGWNAPTNLFEADDLRESLEVLISESGHEEVFAVHFSESMLHADMPIELGAQVGDSVALRDREVISSEPMSIQPSEPDRERFLLEEVNWGAVIDGIPAAQQHAVELGLGDAQLEHIYVSRSHIDLAPIEATLSFEGAYGSERITLDASGKLLPGETLRLLPESVLNTYLFEPQAFDVALEQVHNYAGTDQAIRVMHHGNRFEVEAYESTGDGAATITTITFRNGRIESAEARPAASEEHDDVFDMREIDWHDVLGAIPSLQQLMADAGAVGTVPTHIIAEHELIPDGDVPVVVENVYLSNEAGDGGYVELDSNGDVRSVQGP